MSPEAVDWSGRRTLSAVDHARAIDRLLREAEGDAPVPERL